MRLDLDANNNAHGKLTRPNSPSGARSAPFRTATRNTGVGRRFDVAGNPLPTEPLLDIAANHPPHNLRRRLILLGAKLFEHRLLARINQDRQTSCSFLERDHFFVLHLHESYIVD